MNYKKYFLLGLFILGILVFAGLYFFVIKGKSKSDQLTEDEPVAEIPFEKRPFTTLTPSEDGHYLFLKVINIQVEGATSIDYELLYQTADNITQGVPGTLKLDGKKDIEAEMLLGSESSGKFRYDQGVEHGTLTLRFRNDKGKLVGKLSTDFHLQNGTKDLSSIDGKFNYTLNKTSDAFFVTLETFGLPSKEGLPAEASAEVGPYGVFSSAGTNPGTVELGSNISYWNGSSWKALDNGKSTDTGVFISLTASN